jgi:hypothetical protein
MTQLADLLLTPKQRPGLIKNCASLIDNEVHAKTGLTGLAVKGAFALVKKVKPGIIQDAIERLIDDFVSVLEPSYITFKEEEHSEFDAFLCTRPLEIADQLLAVTDRRIQKANIAVIQKAYQKLRPSGEKYVAQAVPGLAKILASYI